MQSENFEKKKRIVFGGFFVLGGLLLLALIIGPRKKTNENSEIKTEIHLDQNTVDENFQDNIVDNLDDVQDEDFQRSMLPYLTNYQYSDLVKKNVVLRYLKENPRDPLIQKAYSNGRYSLYSYLNDLDEATIDVIIFDNLKSLWTPADYINNYKEEFAIIDIVIINKHPNVVKEIRNLLATNLDNWRYLINGVNFLTRNSLLDSTSAIEIQNYVYDKYNYDQLEERISKIDSELKELREKFSETNRVTDRVISLNGFMIAKLNNYSYEIRVNGSPAILETLVSEFSSRGWFTINAVRNGNKSVPVKEEYGSFTQSWPVYIEVDQEKVDERNRELSDLKHEISDLSNERESAIVKSKKLSNRILDSNKRQTKLKEILLGVKQS